MRFKSIALLAFCIFLCPLLISSSAFASPGSLKITEVYVDFGTPNTLKIIGHGFDTRGALRVRLGALGQLNVLSSSNNHVLAELPSNIAHGNYSLTVSRGRRGPHSGSDSFQVSIGTTGPAGPQGPQGETGDAGASGADGINCWDLNQNGVADAPAEDTNGDKVIDVNDCIGSQGEQGIPGTQGVPGPQGKQGSQGNQGPAGPTGAPGPEGQPGVQGTQGETGPQGPPGVQGPQGEPGPEGPTGGAGAGSCPPQEILLPVGAAIDWLSTSVTPIPEGYQEANGSEVTDPESPLFGTFLPEGAGSSLGFIKLIKIKQITPAGCEVNPCLSMPDGAACDDGDGTTQYDQCTSETCVGIPIVPGCLGEPVGAECSGHGLCDPSGNNGVGICNCDQGHLGNTCELECPELSAPWNFNGRICSGRGTCRLTPDGNDTYCECDDSCNCYGNACQYLYGIEPVA